MRWPRALLDLPGARRRPRSDQAAAAVGGGAEGAGPRRCAGQCPFGLPAPPTARPLSHNAAAARLGRSGRSLSPPTPGARRRALHRHPVRRYPRLHLDLGGQAALRRGVPAQPLFPGDRPGHRGGGRTARQVHRRRRDGAVRADQRARGRLPAGARCGAPHGGRARRPQRGDVGRHRPAVAHRHRPAFRPDHRRRDGLCARHASDGDRRHGEHREPPGNADQGIRRRAGRLTGTAGPRRNRFWRL